MGLSFDEISGQHRDNPSQPSSSQEAASTPPEAQKGPPQDDFEEVQEIFFLIEMMDGVTLCRF